MFVHALRKKSTSLTRTTHCPHDGVIPPPPRGLYLRARARRAALRAYEWLDQSVIRLLSRLLRLDWQVAVTATVYAEVIAEHSQSARDTLDGMLRDQATRIVLYRPAPGGWRHQGEAPIEQVGQSVAILRDPSELAFDPPYLWSVEAVITSTVTVMARDAQVRDSYCDTEPSTATTPGLMPVHAGNGHLRRIPVRRHRS